LWPVFHIADIVLGAGDSAISIANVSLPLQKYIPFRKTHVKQTILPNCSIIPFLKEGYELGSEI